MTRKILLDTNSYLRLAEVFHPLLLSEIPGSSGGSLWILSELYRELERNPRLRVQFSWASLPEFIENRKQCRWHLEKGVREQIEDTHRFAMRYSQQIANGASPFDIRCLAYGSVLDIPVVTDDGDMTVLARELEVTAMSTLGLLHLMHTNSFCELEKVRSTVQYWIAVGDLPARYRSEYKRLFREPPPESAY